MTASQQREAMQEKLRETNDELSVARALFSKLAQDLHAYHLNDGGAGLPSLEGVAKGDLDAAAAEASTAVWSR